MAMAIGSIDVKTTQNLVRRAERREKELSRKGKGIIKQK